MIGQIISHYKILEKLGEGGMGVVYKAEDLKLKRTVALKFLSPQAIGTEEEHARFMHEAQAAAALNHPNICTIYEIDEHDGRAFIAMEHVEGTSLKGKIETRPLELNAALDIALQVASGLREAHEKAIIHRDVKPANIMITSSGRAKIMDFGLAKSKERTRLTRTGSTIGTVAYMSPEQGRGKAADHRSDIWSLGVVLYEMIAGTLPFRGEHEQAMMYSVLNESPRSLTGVRSGVPLDLEAIVGKCLEKEPSERYQHLDDLIVDLKKVASSLARSSKPVATTAGMPPKTRNVSSRVFGAGFAVILTVVVLILVYQNLLSPTDKQAASPAQKVAVLFFQNLGPPEDEYFADGITDAITARLARIHGLGVISRQSTIQYKGSQKSIRTIGDELGVNFVLEGTIQRERPGDPESRIRIIPQLIRVTDDIHLWADTYDEEMTEVFRLQSDIAERVANVLNVTLLDSEREAFEAAPTENLEAYEYYLRGSEFMYERYLGESTEMAAQMFERATEADPEFAAAWAGLAQANIFEYYVESGRSQDRKNEAKAALDMARALGPDLPETQVALGYFYYYGEHDFNRALKHLQNARERSPNNIESINAMGFIKRRQGEWDKAAELLEIAADLNPRMYTSVVELGITCVTMRQYDKAERLLDRAIFLSPEEVNGHIFKILLYLLRNGNVEKAKQTLLSAAEIVKPAQLGFDIYSFPLSRILEDTYFEILSRVPPERYGIDDTTMFHMNLAEAHYQKGREGLAKEYWLKVLSHSQPVRNPYFQDVLDMLFAVAHAGLGRKEEALHIVNKVMEGDPLSQDAFLGTFHLEIAALVFVRTSAYEKAIDQLEKLLSVPSVTSRTLFRIDPAWDPLRDNPRFEKLVAGEP